MSKIIKIQPITLENFKPYGDILDSNGTPDKLINNNFCERYHDKALLDFQNGRAGISIFNATPRDLPYECTMLERHPYGSQAFIPMSENPFLIIVASNSNSEKPTDPQAFITNSGQGINIHKNIWHGVLTPLTLPGLFAVIDRIGPGKNLEEYYLENSLTVMIS
ncbi:MAG: ureidoglycolate lyase [Paracoccaceae bacterium]|mgnify:CR=1 FL=1|jgi:ureidoglycolate lyase|nr:ureidoglycolate lyase [Paracoccaceae bacterium]